MSLTKQLPCRASATVTFQRLADYLEPILVSIATHDLTVQADGAQFKVISPFGLAILTPGLEALHLDVQARDGQSLNRMKHSLVGPITFIAAREKPVIRWIGEQGDPEALADLRVLRVASVQQVSPAMRRIVFGGQDLAHFDRIDQMHCRLIFAPKGRAAVAWPMVDGQGRIVWPGEKLPTRVYTIRAIDVDVGTLTIDFVMHDGEGPATAWARAADIGDVVGIVGPAAGGAKPAAFYVLAGDETGLPGIARILESLPAHARGHAIIEVRDPVEALPLATPPGVAVHWLYREPGLQGGTTSLIGAVRALPWPARLDDVFVWAGCEYQAFRSIHKFLKHDLELPKSQQLLYSHWHRTLSEEDIIEIGGEAYLAE